MVSHWVNCGIFLMAELVAGQGGILSDFCWSSKAVFFLLEAAIDYDWWGPSGLPTPF